MRIVTVGSLSETNASNTLYIYLHDFFGTCSVFYNYCAMHENIKSEVMGNMHEIIEKYYEKSDEKFNLAFLNNNIIFKTYSVELPTCIKSESINIDNFSKLNKFFHSFPNFENANTSISQYLKDFNYLINAVSPTPTTLEVKLVLLSKFPHKIKNCLDYKKDILSFFNDLYIFYQDHYIMEIRRNILDLKFTNGSLQDFLVQVLPLLKLLQDEKTKIVILQMVIQQNIMHDSEIFCKFSHYCNNIELLKHPITINYLIRFLQLNEHKIFHQNFPHVQKTTDENKSTLSSFKMTGTTKKPKRKSRKNKRMKFWGKRMKMKRTADRVFCVECGVSGFNGPRPP